MLLPSPQIWLLLAPRTQLLIHFWSAHVSWGKTGRPKGDHTSGIVNFCHYQHQPPTRGNRKPWQQDRKEICNFSVASLSLNHIKLLCLHTKEKGKGKYILIYREISIVAWTSNSTQLVLQGSDPQIMKINASEALISCISVACYSSY